jgi:osmotically-inducible protein OsmY
MKSDRQLQKDVSAELAWEPSVHAAQIGVEVKGGVVTLAGEVGSYGEKYNAERATQRVSGVKAVASELKVALSETGKRSDSDIARSVENVLEWSTALPDGAVKVLVEKGWVTLTGELEWQYQKNAAVDSIRFLLGVVGVRDQIALKPMIAVSAVKADIEAALKRRAIADAHDISVTVNGADVTLSGIVHSWSERELARESAWGTPGVRNVLDNMTLVFET